MSEELPEVRAIRHAYLARDDVAFEAALLRITSKELVLMRACQFAGHAYKETGVCITTIETSYEERCQYCGKVRWKTPIRDPWTYKEV